MGVMEKSQSKIIRIFNYVLQFHKFYLAKHYLPTSYYIKQRCPGDLSIRSVDLDETLQGSSGYISKNFLFWGQPNPCGRGL